MAPAAGAREDRCGCFGFILILRVEVWVWSFILYVVIFMQLMWVFLGRVNIWMVNEAGGDRRWEGLARKQRSHQADADKHQVIRSFPSCCCSPVRH